MLLNMTFLNKQIPSDGLDLHPYQENFTTVLEFKYRLRFVDYVVRLGYVGLVALIISQCSLKQI